MPPLPKPYPDEIVGSIVVRAGLRYGVSLTALLSWLHGNGTRRSACSFVLVPAVAQVAAPCGLSPRDLLYRHTVFPYVAAYLPSGERIRLEQQLLAPSAPCPPHTTSLVQNVTQAVPYRRYCPECVLSEQSRYGETYWHMLHQLPTVLLCEMHHAPLAETRIRSIVSPRPGEFGLPTANMGTRLDVGIDERTALALLACTLRVISADPNATGDWCQRYRRLASHAGLVRGDGRLATGELARAMSTFYGKALLRSLKCEMPDQAHRAWPALLLRPGPKEPASVVRHVLLDTFLQHVRVDAATVARLRKRAYPARDYAALDCDAVERMKAHLRFAREQGQRLTVRELLEVAEIGPAYRHARARFPRCRQLIADFRRSELSARQLGGREYWRKRLPSRWGLPAARRSARRPAD